MDDLKIRLILETLGTEGVAALRAALDGLHDEAPATIAALTQVDTATLQIEKDIYDLADAYDVLGEEQKGVFTSAVEVGASQQRMAAGAGAVATGLEKTAQSSGAARQGLLDISRAAQDFTQGGIGGILNNLEGLGRALPALLASPMAAIGSFPALLTLAGVALFTFKDQIAAAFTELSGAPKPFLTAVEELEKRLKDLKDKPHPLVIEVFQIEDAQRKLEQLKQALAEYDAQQKKQSGAEATSGKKVQELVTESAFGAAGAEDKTVGMLRDLNLARAKAEGGALDRVLKERATAEQELALAAEGGFVAGDAQRRINASYQEEDTIRRQIVDAAKAEYGGVFLRARTGVGPDQEDAQRRLGVLLGAAGMGDLAGQIGQVSPAQVRLTADLNRQGAEGEVVARAELKREQDARKLGEELTKQGREQEAIGTKEVQAQRKKDEEADAKAFAIEAEKTYKGLEAEEKKIGRTVGQPWQRQYEMAMAQNQERLAQGLPGMAPAQLSQQLQNQMYERLKGRGAPGGAALGAARSIAGKGDEDLGRRAADASSTNLSVAGQTLAITQQLVHEYARQSGTQKELLREAKSQQQQLRSSKRGAGQR